MMLISKCDPTKSNLLQYGIMSQGDRHLHGPDYHHAAETPTDVIGSHGMALDSHKQILHELTGLSTGSEFLGSTR